MTKTGENLSSYSRVGLVDTLSNLEIDSTIYDESSLSIDSGTLSDDIILSSTDRFSSATKQPGNTYNIYVIAYKDELGGDVTIKYVDTEGNAISDNVVKSGNITDEYTTEQKVIDGYTFKEVQGDVSGKFTDQAQTVTYVYTKNNGTPSPKPDDHSNTPESSKTNENKANYNNEDVATLPQTGENEGLSIIGMISGLLLIFGISIMMVFRHKKQD